MTRKRSLTVAITGADGHVGRALLRRLAQSQVETVALVRRPVDRLPASAIVVDELDGPDAQEAMAGADVIVHLAGTLQPTGENSYQKANIGTAAAVAQAVAGSRRTQRIIFLSYLNADPRAGNDYLRTKGIGEQILISSGADVVVFRSAYIIGSPDAPGPQAAGLQAENGKSANVLGSGRQQVTPIYVADVAAFLEAALTRGNPGVYPLAGPDTMSMDELARLVNPAGCRLRHMPAFLARLLSYVVPSLPRPLVDVLVEDCRGDAARAQSEFGHAPRSLAEVWGDFRVAGEKQKAKP
jgi:uncharacterized protein YbjT (DUF2867 family)